MYCRSKEHPPSLYVAANQASQKKRMSVKCHRMCARRTVRYLRRTLNLYCTRTVCTVWCTHACCDTRHVPARTNEVFLLLTVRTCSSVFDKMRGIQTLLYVTSVSLSRLCTTRLSAENTKRYVAQRGRNIHKTQQPHIATAAAIGFPPKVEPC